MAFGKLQAADDKGMFKVPARGLASTGQTVLSSVESRWGMRTAPTIAEQAQRSHTLLILAAGWRALEHQSH